MNGPNGSEQYRQASNLATDSELRQVNTLLYCMGNQAEEVLLSTNQPTEEERKNMTPYYRNSMIISRYEKTPFTKVHDLTNDTNLKKNQLSSLSLHYTILLKIVNMVHLKTNYYETD